MIGALIMLTVTLAASMWTTAYAWTDAIPGLLWLDRVHREDVWLDAIDHMHETLATLLALEDRDLLETHP